MAKIKDHKEKYPLDKFGVESPEKENPYDLEAIKVAEEDIKDFQKAYRLATNDLLEAINWKNKMRFNLEEAKKRLSILKQNK